jgi:hypothetical protein
MMAVIVEVTVSFTKLTLNPKSPLSFFWTSYENSPTGFGGKLNCVLMQCRKIRKTKSFSFSSTIGRNVVIRAPEYQGTIPPGMIVEVSSVI